MPRTDTVPIDPEGVRLLYLATESRHSVPGPVGPKISLAASHQEQKLALLQDADIQNELVVKSLPLNLTLRSDG